MSSRSAGSGRSRDDRVELLHGWDGSSGEASVMKEIFEDRYPDRRVEMTVDPNVSLETKRRFLKRDPPDVWVEWPGPSFDAYGRVGVLNDVSDVWTETDMEREFHETAKEAVRYDGAYRGVPLNINRINHLFYNHELVERAGVDPSRISDPREFVEVLEQVDDALEADGVIMAFLQPFASMGLQLWETMFVGQFGVETYEDVVQGNAERHRDEIREGLVLLDRLLEYGNDDAINLVNSRASDRFADGEAAFRIQGTWAVLGHPDGFEYGRDWGDVPMPGSERTYVINMDAIAAAADPPHPETTRTFIEAMGSADGIERWCRQKQAIPPRSDVSLTGYSEFVREHIRGFEDARATVPSIAHGLAVEPETLVDLEVPFSEFTAERDVDAATDELVAVLQSG